MLVVILLIYDAILGTLVVCSQGSCIITPYYRGTWDIVGMNNIDLRIREDEVSYRNGQSNTILVCVENYKDLLLLKHNSDADGFVCLLLGQMADAGVTIERMNPVPENGGLFDPQILKTSIPVDIQNVCRQQTSHAISYLKRKPGGCTFPENVQNTWNTTPPGLERLVIYDNSVDIVLPGNRVINFVCERNDQNKYLLRTKFQLAKSRDGYACVRFTELSTKELLMVFQQVGQLLNGIVGIVPHQQPLLLWRDCPTESHTEYMLHLHLHDVTRGIRGSSTLLHDVIHGIRGSSTPT